MKTIQLTQGKSTIVDDEDFEKLSKMKWYFRSGYAIRSVYQGYGIAPKQQWMHKLIMDCPVGIQVDHRDGDKLNNTRENLRLATPSQNTCNSKKRSDNSSGFKGASWHGQSGKWRACIQVAGKKTSLGLYSDPEMAHRAYAAAAKEMHGEFAKLS